MAPLMAPVLKILVAHTPGHHFRALGANASCGAGSIFAVPPAGHLRGSAATCGSLAQHQLLGATENRPRERIDREN
eukprot:COSAG05_NODE_681_length_7961_cov_105.324854_6_plen_76_part_00